ncbi:dolichyl-diphosphooligosaccharide--protein glycosyltransferase subunit 2 [Chelonus insularis]|uniref:dolichyl-diphosphooligosaccharide--protein glycosyltransferase subunit 2 n=1 Tax=Chelonus insularis TaxID=460826 RepID=UPI00158D0561|nr:dolichyl-diphosphooligosaccharide--protein glycosyltransferase subunit 2 [Chelonus insularis]
MKNISLRWITLIALISWTLVSSETVMSTESYLREFDVTRLQNVLTPGFELTDIPSVHYATFGYKLLGKAIPKTSEICNFLVKNSGNETSLENIHYIVSTWETLGSCPPLQTAYLLKKINTAIDKETSTIPDLYYALSAYVQLSQPLPDSKATKIANMVQAALKKDDCLQNLGYAFHIAALLGPAGKFALSKIEDAVIQADEINGRYLQFEGGLSITSLVVNGIAQLSNSQNTPPPVKAEQIVKLTNYLISRRSVQTLKGVVKLLSALKMLAYNEFSQPVCTTLAEGGNVVSTKQPFVSIRVCDILGNPLVNIPTVIANSVTRVDDNTAVLTKQNFKSSDNDKTLFTMNLMEIKPQRGFYKINVSAGEVSNTLTVKVLSEVKVDYLEIGTGDADQTTQPKLLKVAYPNKLAHKIEADSQQKLVMRFMLRDAANNKPMRVHQAFVRLSAIVKPGEDKQPREVIFVAEPDASNVYKFDMPVGSDAQTFGFQSGDYHLNLIIGDALISNPFQWEVAVVGLKFPEPTGTDAVTISKLEGLKKKSNIYAPKSEIKHMFREPEKRPPVFVSNLFTGLCLAPLLLLLILWAKLDVNIAKFPFSLSAVLFHVGLGSIFVLFGVFWLKLNMFVTLRYLLGLGVVTFLAGSKLLSHIAHNQKVTR